MWRWAQLRRRDLAMKRRHSCGDEPQGLCLMNPIPPMLLSRKVRSKGYKYINGRSCASHLTCYELWVGSIYVTLSSNLALHVMYVFLTNKILTVLWMEKMAGTIAKTLGKYKDWYFFKKKKQYGPNLKFR